MDSEEQTVSRLTRSATNDESQEAEKFDFDTDEYEINSEKKLRFVFRALPNTDRPPVGNAKERMPKRLNQTTMASSNLNQTKDSITKMILEIENISIKISDKTKDKKAAPKKHNAYLLDPLSDSIYLPYHRKMLKQEIRMINKDIQESETNADKLYLMYDKLNMPTWPVTLQRITKINNPTDDDEMKSKRILTKNQIKIMLEKFELMKRHDSILQRNKRTVQIDAMDKWADIYKHVDRRFIQNYDSSTDEEEENLPLDEIKTHRRYKREQSCGGTITIGLNGNSLANSKYVIIAEPLRKPYVIRSSKVERNKWKNINIEHKVFKYYRILKNNVATKKQKITIPLTFKVDKDLVLAHIDDEQSSTKEFAANSSLTGEVIPSTPKLGLELPILPTDIHKTGSNLSLV